MKLPYFVVPGYDAIDGNVWQVRKRHWFWSTYEADFTSKEKALKVAAHLCINENDKSKNEELVMLSIENIENSERNTEAKLEKASERILYLRNSILKAVAVLEEEKDESAHDAIGILEDAYYGR